MHSPTCRDETAPDATTRSSELAWAQFHPQTIDIGDTRVIVVQGAFYEHLATFLALDPHAEPQLSVREMKLYSEHYESVITLLVLPRAASAWPPWSDTGAASGTPAICAPPDRDPADRVPLERAPDCAELPPVA